MSQDSRTPPHSKSSRRSKVCPSLGVAGAHVFALFAATTAGPSSAQTTAVYGGNPNRIDLSVPVTASIASRCAFSPPPSGSYDAGDITRPFTHDFPFSVRCNTPFRVAVVSQNGSLKAPIAPTPGYAASTAYDVTLALVGGSNTPPATATCTAASLSSTALSPCGFRGPASATSGLRLDGRSNGAVGSYLRVSSPGVLPTVTLIASPDYRDVLTVSISPSN